MVSFTTGAVWSAILATAGLLVMLSDMASYQTTQDIMHINILTMKHFMVVINKAYTTTVLLTQQQIQ